MHFLTTTQLIAKEGWRDVCVAGVIFVIAYSFSCFASFFFLILMGTLLFYRNPERLLQEEDTRALVAPVDGMVSSIEKVTASDGKEWLKVIIKKRLFDVSVVRSPLQMHVLDVKKKEGLPLDTNSPLARTLRTKVVFTCKYETDEIRMVLYAGLFSKQIDISSKRGRFKVGERLAFLAQGDVALLLPLDTRIKVVLNDEVKAGESVLGYLAHRVNHE